MEKRNFRQADLGLDIHHLDGYRVVYEDISKNGGKTITRLLDEYGNVMTMLLSDIRKPNVYAYAEMIRLYLEPKKNEKLEKIKELSNAGFERKDIAEKLGMSVYTIGDYLRFYDIKHKQGYSEEKRFSANEFLGLDLNILDGYRVSYEYVYTKRYKYIIRLIDESGRVLAMARTLSENKVLAYAYLIQAYVSPSKDTQIRLDAIKKLYDAGTSKIDISKILNITRQSLNDYFYYYNLDNRNNF
ncbi:hypothetical protein [Enterococcus cecorum]|uniref:hypothetical protein n=1 Tax=Enterococcus cecorum TaxID=44008 RepID=UPI00148D5AAA|nr:hypothetical protein [Enterococcus cecorum]